MQLAKKLIKFCKKCQDRTTHRLVVKGNYYHCTICSENNSKRHRHKHWLRYIAQKANARKRPDSEKITEDMLKEIWNKQAGKCALTGVNLGTSGGYQAASVDRINSERGYTKDNIRLTTWLVNHIRGDLTDKEFTDACNGISTTFKNRELFKEIMVQDLIERYP